MKLATLTLPLICSFVLSLATVAHAEVLNQDIMSTLSPKHALLNYFLSNQRNSYQLQPFGQQSFYPPALYKELTMAQIDDTIDFADVVDLNFDLIVTNPITASVPKVILLLKGGWQFPRQGEIYAIRIARTGASGVEAFKINRSKSN